MEIAVSDICNFAEKNYQKTTPAEVLFILNLNSTNRITADSVIDISNAIACWLFFEIKVRGALSSDQLSLTFQTFGDVLLTLSDDIVSDFEKDNTDKIQNYYIAFADRRFVTLTESNMLLDLSTGHVEEIQHPNNFVEGLTYNITKIACDLLMTVRRAAETHNATN